MRHLGARQIDEKQHPLAQELAPQRNDRVGIRLAAPGDHQERRASISLGEGSKFADQIVDALMKSPDRCTTQHNKGICRQIDAASRDLLVARREGLQVDEIGHAKHRWVALPVAPQPTARCIGRELLNDTETRQPLNTFVGTVGKDDARPRQP